MACDRGAPLSLINSLIAANKEAVATRGFGGNFPLHIAAEKELDSHIIATLIRKFPYALEKCNYSDRRPFDFVQRDSFNHELLTRPIACWIEDVEKQEYIEAVEKRKISLRQTIDKVKKTMAVSKENRMKLEIELLKMNPIIDEMRKKMESVKAIECALDEIESKMKLSIKKLKERADEIKNNLPQPLTEEEAMMRSMMKSSYMTTIQKNHQTFHLEREALQKEIKNLEKDIMPWKQQQYSTEQSEVSFAENDKDLYVSFDDD
eukprot:CAMPEP_0184871158 /NCGR_PEP_ID=MMETSP0580-20130426/40207_1 /TAXON_ID=1118495 /ORGANISM="Dactyliosolen fragilissimus" /LENGTH=262 /DNA_ID=CAMNT_0027373715 /DNA_START=196 /DNA_END=984 /DNA_ORIENTATION=-